MRDIQLLVKEMKHLVFSINPHIGLLDMEAASIADFYQPFYDYRLNQKVFPESRDWKELIISEVSGIYGQAKGLLVADYLEHHFLAETATHYSFPRSFDNHYGISCDSALTWNSYLISAAMAKLNHQKIHFGIYATHIPFTTINSPATIEVDVANYAKVNPARLGAKYVCFSEIKAANIANAIRTLRENAMHHLEAKIRLLNPGEEDRTAANGMLHEVRRQNPSMDTLKRLACKTRLLREVLLIVDKYEEEMAFIQGIAQRFKGEGDFFDNTVLVHKYLLDDLLNAEASGIEQITLSNGILIKFLISQLKKEDSWLYQLFSDAGRLSLFVDMLSGIRSGWHPIDVDGKSVQSSPFYAVTNGRERTKLELVPYRYEELIPDKLIYQLEHGLIYPTNAMQIMLFISSGLLPMGGMLQSLYGSEIGERLCTFLEVTAEPGRRAEIQKMPLKLSLHAAAFSSKADCSLSTYHDLKKLHREIPYMLETVPHLPVREAFLKALPALYQFFTYYVLDRGHPDYRKCVLKLDELNYHEAVYWQDC